ncbi:hypothetical protein EVAR_11431_1 [Eumeta japonica]|uniref:Uncharacterized protein n=1 Tax=Eumeta variegata TaxID=151549 RepID=A0A4C1TNG9_EUMVA|nr:hypothetical protein EVAR_11431_1 [Eumeta japonica]
MTSRILFCEAARAPTRRAGGTRRDARAPPGRPARAADPYSYVAGSIPRPPRDSASGQKNSIVVIVPNSSLLTQPSRRAAHALFTPPLGLGFREKTPWNSVSLISRLTLALCLSAYGPRDCIAVAILTDFF